MSISGFILRKAPAWFVAWSFKKIFGKKNLDVFKRILELPNWEKISYDSPEKWIFQDDNSFVIEISNESRTFSERWTEDFPANSKAVEVFLKINGERVHTPLLFVAVDDWRYFVPCPKIGEAYGESYYYFDSDSLEYKVFKVIGSVDYLYKSLESFAIAKNILFK